MEELDLSKVQIKKKTKWVIEGLIARGTINFFIAPNSLGKSTLAIDLALKLADNGVHSWMRHKIPETPLSILYLALEDKEGAKEKFQDLASVLEVTPKITLGDSREDFKNINHDVVIVDNLGDLVGGEIGQNDVRRMVEKIQNNGVTYLFLHHTRKGNQHVYLGSGVLEDIAHSLSLGFFSETDDDGMPDKTSDRLFIVKKNKKAKVSTDVYKINTRDVGLSCFVPEIEPYDDSEIDNGTLRLIELARTYFALKQKRSAIGLWKYMVGDEGRTNVPRTLNRKIKKFIMLKEGGFSLDAEPYLKRLGVIHYYKRSNSGFFPKSEKELSNDSVVRQIPLKEEIEPENKE